MTIFYYLPVSDRPSWGAGMICYHLYLLQNNGFNSVLICDNPGFYFRWINLSIRCIKPKMIRSVVSKNDILVVPEFYAGLNIFRNLSCRKIVFVQNAYYIQDGLKNDTYESLGYDTVFYYMPHLKEILQPGTASALYEIPPFVAPYFYDACGVERKKTILLYPKFGSRDYNILEGFLSKNAKGFEIRVLQNMSHFQVAQEMHAVEFFISLNTHEAFNSSVPEAMASGAINFCYDAYGPLDYLIQDHNAFYFPNGHIFSLIKKLQEAICNYDQFESVRNRVRENAFKTAEQFEISFTETALVNFFSGMYER